MTAPKASIIYWYAGDDLRLDGGGLRAVAWERALTKLGYQSEILPLWTLGGAAHGSALSAVKRAFVPMPIRRSVEVAGDSDLVVATVPAVFHALTVPRERLVFDWMDRWSVNARNMGNASFLSRPGGLFQSVAWRHWERQLPLRAHINTFAGYEDYDQMSGVGGSQFSWLPTPVSKGSSSRRPPADRIARVGFIGTFYYPPNEVSLKRFFHKYRKKVEASNIEFVVGGFGSERVSDWGVPATVLGEIDDVAAFYASIDAAIVPVDHGGGIKVKAVEALRYGLPVYGTQHVRNGFSSEYHPWVRSLDELFESRAVSSAAELPATLDARLTAAGFESAVAGLLANMHELP